MRRLGFLAYLKDEISVVENAAAPGRELCQSAITSSEVYHGFPNRNTAYIYAKSFFF